MELHIIEPAADAIERRSNSVPLMSVKAVEDDGWSTLGHECAIFEILVSVEDRPDEAVAGRMIRELREA
jgi:hypothetical protein